MRWLRYAILSLTATVVSAQSTATLSGVVADPSGAPVEQAAVVLFNELTGYRNAQLTTGDGRFLFTNVPLHNYQLSIEKPGFAADRRSVPLRSNVPESLEVRLKLAHQSSHIDVSVLDSVALVEPESTGTRVELNSAAMEQMPTPAGSRGLESLLLSFPGFAPNANGAIHPRGAHNQMSFIIDGMPVTDQLTGAFANAVDPSIVQTVELFTGNVPVEFGNKLSGVAVVTTRSGLGSGRLFWGSTQVTAAGFDTLGQITQVAGGTERFGYFVSANTVKSNRFLDQVTIDNLHNGGNSERAFARFDYHAGPTDFLRLNLLAGRSSFQLANLRSQHASGQDQRQQLEDLAASVGWLHTFDGRSTFDTVLSYRTAVAQLFPSADDTPVTAAQARHLTTATVGARYTRLAGWHSIRGGVDYQRFPVSENFSFGITDPNFNHPNSPDFIATLLTHDLSRGGRLFHFSGAATGSMRTAFLQDEMRFGRLTVSIGARYDQYRFLVDGNQLQPRAGLAFHIRETGTVVRASYNRTYQTPPNENLLLSNSDASGVLVPPDVRDSVGSALLRIRPERQNVYEAGVQQAIGRLASFNAAFYHKNSRDMQDNDNFFNTGIIFPTSLKQSRVNGAEARLTILPVRGFSGSLSMTHYHVVVTPPFTGGLFLGSAAVDLLSAGPFIIDHDQALGVHGLVNYRVKRNIWLSASVRYDSGLVSNPSDPVEVAADPDYFDLLPYVNLGSNPPRVRPRTIVDLSAGYERLREGRGWDVQVQVSNITDQTALYNFQSIFVGTRLVQPRTVGVKLRYRF